MKIRIFYDDVDFRLRGSRKAKEIFKKVIGKENRIPGDLNFIVSSDENIKNINIEFLKHNYFTDVIAFDNSEGNVVSGEIYLSIDTVRENALNYNVSLKIEVMRVMIHGLLHLCGYRDDTSERKQIMRDLEDFWLTQFISKEDEV